MSARSQGDCLLGAHMSIAGGIDQAPLRGQQVGCQTIQIFTKSNNQWQARPLSETEVEGFLANQRQCNIAPVFAHDSYLINLGSPDPALNRKSRQAFLLEMERAERLHLPYLVAHPGAHMGAGEADGLKRIAEALNDLHSRTRGFSLMILLENTAGQGSTMGYRFEHLATLLDLVEERQRLGVCFDTCHALAAGYDLRSEQSYDQTIREFDQLVGLKHIKAFHLNDAKKGLGCRVDRHEHIGQGALGLTAFACLLNDPRFRGIPMVLETPKGKEMQEDRMNLTTLRRLIRP